MTGNPLKISRFIALHQPAGRLIDHLHLELYPKVSVNVPELVGDPEGKIGHGQHQVLMLPSFGVDTFTVISYTSLMSDQIDYQDSGISSHSSSAAMRN